MKRKYLFFLILLFPVSFCLYDCSRVNDAQGTMNLDFEFRNPGSHLPKYWYTFGESFKITIDSLEKKSGEFSLKMERSSLQKDDSVGTFLGILPVEPFLGKNVEYRGWIKTENVKNGYAGLWLRADGEYLELIDLENMDDRRLSGDNDWTQVSIKTDISSETININYGGEFKGEGMVWFDNLELYVDGERFIEPRLQPTLSRKEKRILEEYIYPLRTYEPDSGDTKDLEVPGRLIGGSKVVALGEVSHGSSEIFKMKNRIIQYLAANNGFDIFSIEANMPESYKLNDYVVHGEGDIKKLIAGFFFWLGNTEEVLDMVQWMHLFNQTEKRIEFTGFDMQFYEGAIDVFVDAFKGDKVVENKIAGLRKILEEIKTRAYRNRRVISSSVEDNEMKEINHILSFLQNSIETSSFQISEKQWLRQNVVILQQYLGIKNYLWRDKYMADNIMWIKENNPDSKLIIWAHNMHIQKAGRMMGDYLARKLKDDYVTFGFTFYEGSFMGVGNKGLTVYEASKAHPGTLEYLLNQLEKPVFILDLKRIKSDNRKEIEWLSKPLAYRSVGATGGTQYEFKNRTITDDFDYLVFIKTSTPAIPLSDKP